MNKKIIVIFALVFLLLSCFSFAETIALKSGKTVEGRIIEKTDEYIKVDVAGVPLTYYLDEVLEIKEAISTDVKSKKAIVYKVTKKFYLKALGDVHYLKFCMPLPSKKILYQKIAEMRVFPKNNAFIKDSSDNDVPIYYYELVKGGTAAITGVNYTVEIETELFSINPSSIPDEYHSLDKNFEQYLGSEGDIDIQSPLVQEKARLIIGTIKNPYEKAKAIYDFITKNMQYDYELLEKMAQDSSSYASNKPEDTLVYKKGICYDIAKLFVALARAGGVPARVVRGIVFDPQKHTAKLTAKYGHAWAEIYLPSYGWLTVDPTFGISKEDAFYCFNNTSHIGEEYGLASAQEFGSLEKGWALQIRAQDRPVRFPVDVDMVIEIERVSE